MEQRIVNIDEVLAQKKAREAAATPPPPIGPKAEKPGEPLAEPAQEKTAPEKPAAPSSTGKTFLSIESEGLDPDTAPTKRIPLITTPVLQADDFPPELDIPDEEEGPVTPPQTPPPVSAPPQETPKAEQAREGEAPYQEEDAEGPDLLIDGPPKQKAGPNTSTTPMDDPDLDAPLPPPGREPPVKAAPTLLDRLAAWRLKGQQHPILTKLVCVVLVLAGLLFLFRDQLPLDRFLRWYHYSNVAGEASFAHNVQRLGVFVGHEQKLIVCTETQLQVFSPTGEVYLNEPMNMSAPAVSTAKGAFVVYDVGGHELRVVKGTQVAFALTLETGQTILSASLNDAGWLAVTSKQDGHKGVVTIYNANYETRMSIRLSSCYLTDAVVTPDCSGVYAISPGQRAGTFESNVLYFTIPNPTTDTPIAQISLGNNIVLSSRSTNNACWILGENRLFFLSSNGSLANQFDYGGRYLKKGSLQGNGFAALLLSNSQSSSAGTVVTVSRKGEAIASLDINEPVTTLAASGNYVAILTGSHLYLYNKDLELLSESDQVIGFSSIVLFPDGSMNLISEELATLYLP